MPTARKRKSGKWQVRVYDFTDADGKQHMKAFTADTKKEAERMANAYRDSAAVKQDATVAEAVKAYMEAKEAVLSPSTFRSYDSIYRTHFQKTRFGAMKLSRLNLQTVQIWVSSLQSDRKAKTVKNIYNLFTPAVHMFRPDLLLPVTLPAMEKPNLHTPTVAEVETLVNALKNDHDTYICVLLCAFGPMRRSEACAVRYDDIDYKTNTITVRRACVYDKAKEWIYKDTPKTSASFRRIIYPAEVVQAIGKGFGYVIAQKSPAACSDKFKRVIVKAGLPDFRIHDLRHYAASVLHAIGIPDQYIMARGGWQTDACMKRVYRDTMSDFEMEMQQRAVAFFQTNLEPKLEPEKDGTA